MMSLAKRKSTTVIDHGESIVKKKQRAILKNNDTDAIGMYHI